MINVDGFKNTGWICPKCGRVMAPHVVECVHCNKVEEVIINTVPCKATESIANTATINNSTNTDTITIAKNNEGCAEVKPKINVDIKIKDHKMENEPCVENEPEPEAESGFDDILNTLINIILGEDKRG